MALPQLLTFRVKVIDSKLPYHPTLDTLVCMSASSGEDSSSVLWPSFIEKGARFTILRLIQFLTHEATFST